jgi:hypothetical protein
MPKYIGLPYNPKGRNGPIDRLALAKTFDVNNPELDRLLTDLTERINTITAMVWENRAREAHDLPYTDAAGSRTNIGDAMESLEGTDHARLHGIDDTADHNGVSGATEDNFASFDANGLPKDSGSDAGSFDAAGSAAAVASDLSDHESDTSNPHGVTAAQANAIPVEASSTDNAIVRWDGTGGDAVQDSGAFVDDDGTLRVPAGYIYIGEDDAARGFLKIYGDGAGQNYSGAIQLYISADYDDTVNYYNFQALQDDLRIGPNTNLDFLKITAEGVFQVEGEARLDAHGSMGANDASLATKKYVDDEVAGAEGGTRWQRMLTV